MCYTQNRATLHLHGGATPWISDGTPHQWITPGQRDHGAIRRACPSRTCPTWSALVLRPVCRIARAASDGCQTFYYTNQQSARLMFYHDHAWGITRLNVYAGEAAGYVLTDPTEQKLIGRRWPSRRPRRRHSARHPGPHLRPVRRPARWAGPDVGRLQVGRLREPVVPPRLHARPEPERPVGHERLWPLVLRTVVLAAGHAAERPDRQPVLPDGPEGPGRHHRRARFAGGG